MSLKHRILTGYVVVFVLMGLVVGWSVANLILLGRAADAILRENYRSIQAAEHMMDALERHNHAVVMSLFEPDDLGGYQRFSSYETMFLKWLARAGDNLTIPGEPELVRAVESGYAEYMHQIADMPGLKAGAGQAEISIRKQTYQTSVYPVFEKVRDACIQLRSLNEDTMYASGVRAGEVARRAIWSSLAVAVSGLLLALIFTLLLVGRIIRSLHHFMEASRKIAGGDYSVQVPIETGDELGHLGDEFNRMAAQLSHYHAMNIEQILSEKRKGEAILASIDDGLVVFDTQLRVADINPAAHRMLAPHMEDCRQKYCLDVVSQQRLCDLIQRTARDGFAPKLDENECFVTVGRGDEMRHYLFSITVIRSQRNDLAGIVLLLRDVTRLMEVERLKSEFVMAASHELRTPLTSIGMSIELLLERMSENISPKDLELLKAAHEEVQRLKALVADLLDLSKIEAGRIALEFDNVALPFIVERVHTVFKSQLEARSVDFSSRLPESLPEVRADANKIAWVMTNLISNALRYVPEKGHIQVSGKKVGRHVHISVQDDGPGIPPEYQSKIFHKFVQVKGREAGGTGLGLAICKEIVRAHGGVIWVESMPGKGSTFTFTLKAVEQEDTDAHQIGTHRG